MSQNETPENVADLATQADTLPSESLILIGLFGPADNLRALLRRSSGKTLMVKIGDKTPKGHVAAIDPEGVILQTRSKTEKLSMPA